jgi:beta-glucanase (GH16 family)
VVLLSELRTLVVVVVVAAALSLATTPARAQSWSDEMNGSNGAAAHGSYWNFDTGGGGWGNNELQTYTSGTANVWHENGYLRIQGKSGNPMTSGRIKTLGKKAFGPYGRMEARLRGPNDGGYWPAFWMLGNNHPTAGWPACGEIDIMEHANAWSYFMGTIHWQDPGGNPAAPHWVMYSPVPNAAANDFTQWHNYGIEWNGTLIKWFRDNQWLGEVNITPGHMTEFHQSYYLIFNLALGGNFTGNVTPTVFPRNFDIDWVRWWNNGAGYIQTGSNVMIRAQHSGKCIDADNNGTANGTKIHQWGGGTNDDCNGSGAQKWRFTATDSGYYRIGNQNNTNQVIDIKDVSTANGADMHLWAYVGGNNQQWRPELVQNGSGVYYRFVSRHSGKCLDVPGWSTANGALIEQYNCNSTTNQLFALQ